MKKKRKQFVTYIKNTMIYTTLTPKDTFESKGLAVINNYKYFFLYAMAVRHFSEIMIWIHNICIYL